MFVFIENPTGTWFVKQKDKEVFFLRFCIQLEMTILREIGTLFNKLLEKEGEADNVMLRDK